MNALKVGLLGYGMAGRIFHAPLIDKLDGLELAMIRESRAESIKLAHERYPNAQIVQQANHILRNSEIDLVVVATPNKTHYSLAKAALEANKHVVVEKPFTVSCSEADELIALAEKKKKVLTIYHNRRWDSDFLTVQKVIASKKLGRIVEFESHYDRFRNTLRSNSWKEEDSEGTGLLYDLGSHLIDQAQILFGLPEYITGFMAVQRDNSNIIDSFEVLLHYSNIKVTLKAGMLIKEPLPKYVILGTCGSFVKYGLDVQEAHLKTGNIPLADDNWGKEPEEIWGILNTEVEGINVRGKIESERGNYLKFYKNVYNAILGKEELIVTPRQARNTIRLIELAIQSSKDKRTLPFE